MAASARMLSRLRRAVQKVKLILLTLDRTKWLLSSFLRSPSGGPRRLSFNTSPPSLLDTLEDEEDRWASSPSTSSGRISVSRTTSAGSASLDHQMSRTSSEACTVEGSEDIDERAEKFIENFYRQLRMERQVSLELRYCREGSLERSSSG